MNTRDYLALKRSVNVIPLNNTEVILYRAKQKSLKLSSERINLLALIESLQQGAIMDELLQKFAKDSETREVVEKLIDKLQRTGVLMHPLTQSEQLTTELRWFDRLLGYFGDVYEDADHSRIDHLHKLRRAHILFIGIGTMASWTILNMTANGIGRITAVDNDVLEDTNFSRQAFYAESDINVRKKKLIAAESAIRRLTGFTKFHGIDRTITSAEDVIELLDGVEKVDLIVLTADRPPWKISQWVAKAAYETSTPLIRGNMKGIGPLMLPGKTACPACAWTRLIDQVPNAEALIAYKSSGRVPNTANSAAISTELAAHGSLLAHEILTFLTDAEQAQTYNKQIKVRLTGKVSVEISDFPRDPHCPVCS